MKYSARQYAEALMDSLEGAAPKDQDVVLDNFVKILAANNDTRLVDEIAEQFRKLELQKKGIKQVEITSAHALKPQTEARIVDELNRLAHGKLEVTKKVDEQLIGGVVVRLEDQVLDASVKNNLEQLKQELEK